MGERSEGSEGGEGGEDGKGSKGDAGSEGSSASNGSTDGDDEDGRPMRSRDASQQGRGTSNEGLERKEGWIGGNVGGRAGANEKMAESEKR